MRARKFLGYMVTKRGIEVNPLKVKAIQEMSPPQTLKEPHETLTGRIVPLRRFISRLADHNIPFFMVLRKNKTFEWIAECQTAFEQLVEFLASLPLLKQPTIRKPLIMYLVAREESVCSILVQEEGEKFPIYLVSRVLHGAELRY